MSSITIKDIAKIAGVSHPTVSKALNNAPGVKDSTRLRITELAEQMNYVPNIAAKRLANKSNRSLGLVWPQIEGLFFYHLCNELQKEAKLHGVDVFTSMSDPANALRTFNEHFVDFVLCWFFPEWTPSTEFMREKSLYKGEMVIVGGGSMGNTHMILIDRTQSIYMAVKYLSEIGHKKVAFVGPQGEKSVGYMKGMLELSMEYHIDYMIDISTGYYNDVAANRVELQQKFADLWISDHRPTALILESQDIAFGMVNVFRDLNISIPDQLSIISYDDIPELSIYQVPLTTCGPSIKQIAKSVLSLYEEYYKGAPPKRVVYGKIKPKLVIRESTKAI